MTKIDQSNSDKHADSTVIFKDRKSGVDISFDNISYKVKIPDDSQQSSILPFKKIYKEKLILREISGIFKAGRVTAIMGASGAGKTTLLNILACRIDHNSAGILYANNLQYNYSQFGDFANYVMQADLLMETLTVRETLQFATKLKINASDQQRHALVERISNELKLEKCLDTMVGGVIMKGVSGGQKKRASIAFELISDPQVIFLDQPTSGLDSLTSYIIVSYIRKLARRQNKTVIMTIHQPNSETYQLFDDLLLLVQGKIIYQGQAGSVTNYFRDNFNLPCPQFSNPPDFFMSKIHHEDPANKARYTLYMETYDSKVKPLIQKDIQNHETSDIIMRTSEISKLTIYLALLYRNLVNVLRNPMLQRSKVGQGIFVGLYLGGMYFKKGQGDMTQPHLWQTLTGFLFFICISAMMSALSPTAITFPLERPVFIKEQDSKMYGVLEYSVARFLMDLPEMFLTGSLSCIILYFMVGLNHTAGQFFVFLLTYLLTMFCGSSIGILIGSVVADAKTVSTVNTIVLVPLMIFSGFFKNRADLPGWIGWIEYISPIKYAFISFVKNQVGSQPSLVNQLNFDMGKWEAIGFLAVIGVGYRIVSIFCLWYLRSKSQ